MSIYLFCVCDCLVQMIIVLTVSHVTTTQTASTEHSFQGITNLNTNTYGTCVFLSPVNVTEKTVIG